MEGGGSIKYDYNDKYDYMCFVFDVAIYKICCVELFNEIRDENMVITLILM